MDLDVGVPLFLWITAVFDSCLLVFILGGKLEGIDIRRGRYWIRVPMDVFSGLLTVYECFGIFLDISVFVCCLGLYFSRVEVFVLVCFIVPVVLAAYRIPRDGNYSRLLPIGPIRYRESLQ